MVKKHPLFITSILAPIALVAFICCGVRPDRDAPSPPLSTAVTSNPSATPTDNNPNGIAVVDETPESSTRAPTIPMDVPTGTTEPAADLPVTPATPTDPIVTPSQPTEPVGIEPTTPVVVTPPAPLIDWAYVSEKFFVPNCVRCHGDAGDINLESYAAVKPNLDAIRAAVLVKKRMPPRKTLPAESTDILKAWLDAGAPETVAN